MLDAAPKTSKAQLLGRIWVGHRHGSTCPNFLSACSGRLGALEYRGVDSRSTIPDQTRMITVRSVKVFLGSSEQSSFKEAIPLAKRFHIL